MSLDKFGRQLLSNNGGSGLRGPKGEGFTLTPEGNYDMQLKRLCNLSNPSHSNDAVTLDFLNRTNTANLKLSNGQYDANKKAITNIGVPKHDSDAVNLRYFKSRSLDYNIKTKEFDAKGGRIVNLAMPKQLLDAVNYKYLISTLISLSYTIYKQLHKDKKKLKSLDEWSNKILTAEYKWDELFSIADDSTADSSSSSVEKPAKSQ